MNSALSLEIDGASQVFGIIGDPVSHSFSPVFWNRALAFCGINATYVPFRVCRADLAEAITGLKALGVKGINVTSPHKHAAASFCDTLYSPADGIKAVNCMKFCEDGPIEGWNTDATGFLRILERLGRPQTGLVMGSGGAAAAASQALLLSGARVFQIARSFSDAIDSEPSDSIKRLAWHEKNFAQAIEESDIIINATPLGWHKDDFVAELKEFLSKNKFYVDFNYAPTSRLVATARQKGCNVIDGRELLLEQGLESFRLLTGQTAPEQLIRRCIFGG
ncbi:MAG: Shikimate 5-dehydrogenase I alpha [Candidatus Rifleibacterium amylolyticum]|nr:MAG: Shikimate 5-dehydrogenase I alpha [Candidatus Rifleibacterium amylolyticum]